MSLDVNMRRVYSRYRAWNWFFQFHAWRQAIEDYMLTLSAKITCVLFFGDLLFILFSRQKSTEDFRYLPIYATFACLAVLAIRNVKTTSYKECFQISLLASISFVILHQFIGWIWFPGVVKSNSFLSVENLQLGIALFSASALLLLIGLSLAKVITRLWGRK